MKKINCLIVEDEPIAQEILENFIERLPFLELKGKVDNAIQAYEILSKTGIDLIFCDIQMPQISGLEFVKSLVNRPYVIMTTAFHQHAHEGFELDVIDYLLKPIAFERFLRAVQKVKEKIDVKDILFNREEPPKEAEAGSAETNEFIFVKEDGKLIKVNLSEIQYIEGMKDYVKIYLEKRFVVTYLTMKKLEETLPENMFIRNHKSYIVNVNKIDSLNGNMLGLESNTQIPVGMQHREAVLKKIGNKLLIR